MLAAMEHSEGPDAEARAALRSEAGAAEGAALAPVPAVGDRRRRLAGPGDCEGDQPLENDRACELERAERPRGRDGVRGDWGPGILFASAWDRSGRSRKVIGVRDRVGGALFDVKGSQRTWRYQDIPDDEIG